MQYSTNEGAQGICPTGWHIPADSDWKDLETELGMLPDELEAGGWRGIDQGIGTQLKQGGASGFEALLAGYTDANHHFSSLGKYGQYSSSTEVSTDVRFAKRRLFDRDKAGVIRDDLWKNFGASVRCLKD